MRNRASRDFEIPPEWKRVGQAEALAYWEDRHRAHGRFESVGYAGAGEAYNAWLYRVRRRLFRRHVAPLVGAGDSVLDVASGTGFYLERWREAGIRELRGSDVSPTAVKNLRASFPDLPIHQFDVAGAIEELPQPPADVVSAFDLLYHLIDDAAYRLALANLGRLTRPGGLLVISENFRRVGPRRYASVQVNREEGEILRALDEAGFDVVKRRPLFVLMNAPACGGPDLLHTWWQRVHRLLTTRPGSGAVLGPALYPLELCCVSITRPAPSTELAICRRR